MLLRKVICIPLVCATAVLAAALSAGERPDPRTRTLVVPARARGSIGAAALTTSLGEVRVDCADPGPWTFALESSGATGGVETVRVTMRSEQEAAPPKFAVAWFVPQTDVHHVWSSGSTHYGLPWNDPMCSELSSSMPVYSLLDADDNSRFAFACSESCRRVLFRCPVSETKMGFSCSFEFFTVPEAPIREYAVEIRLDSRRVFYGDAIGDAVAWIVRAAGIEPLRSPEAAFEPLYSTWYDFHQDISAAGVEKECARAAELGMRTVIVDDGWQIDLPLGNRPWNGYRLCGDWEPGRHFPDMAAHVKRVQDMGFKYMMWYSVPFVGKDSRNFSRFKGKFLPVECAGGHVLDPRFPEVRAFIAGTYEDAVRKWNIDGLKLDFIGRFTLGQGQTDPAVAEGYAGRDVKSIPLAVEVLLSDTVRRLRALKPDILIEFRQPYVGPSIRRFGNMLRASDCPLSMVENRTRIARLRLTSGGTAVHSDMLEWRGDETAESAARHILNSIFGVVQYSLHLDSVPDRHREMMAHWIRFSTTHREALVKGRFRPHHPAADYPLLEGESAAERIFGVYQRDLIVDAGEPDRTVFVLNGANATSLPVRFRRAPARVEVRDTFGELVAVPVCGAGLNSLSVPVSGYVKVLWHNPAARMPGEAFVPSGENLRLKALKDGFRLNNGVISDEPVVAFSNGTVATCQLPVADGDFGKDAFGWLEARATVPGTYVVCLGEQRLSDGTVNIRPQGTIRGCAVTCEVSKVWTRVPLIADIRNTKGVNGRAIAVTLPSEVGVVMPFRYVEKLSGPGSLSFRRQFVHWPMECKAMCPINDMDVKRVWDFCQYSIIATSFAGVMVDGDRERIPYEGDIYINMLGQLYGVDGDPELSRRSIRHVLKYPTWPTEWKQHAIMCVWEDWHFTKSTELAAECYDQLKREKLMLERARSDGLLPSDNGDIIDWPQAERDGYDMKTPCSTVVNAFHYRNLLEMADLATALGKTDDAQRFRARAGKVRDRFNALFWDAKRGLYVDGEGARHISLHANVAALDFGLVPANRQADVLAFIANRGMACSPYFAQYYLEALCKFGRKDVALKLMTAKGDRSWMGMLEQGATMTMEAWSIKAKPNQDWNHAWGTAPLNILARFFRD